MTVLFLSVTFYLYIPGLGGQGIIQRCDNVVTSLAISTYYGDASVRNICSCYMY